MSASDKKNRSMGFSGNSLLILTNQPKSIALADNLASFPTTLRKVMKYYHPYRSFVSYIEHVRSMKLLDNTEPKCRLTHKAALSVHEL